MVCFGTLLPVTYHQLPSLSAAKAEVFVGVFALRPQLPLFRLQLGVPGLLLFLHHHGTLDSTLQRPEQIASNTPSKSRDCSRSNFLMIRGNRPNRRLHAKESGAVVWATVTSSSPVAHTVQVVVERQLCVCRNMSHQTGHPACSKGHEAYIW